MSEVEVLMEEALTTVCRSSKGDEVITHGPKAYGGKEEKFSPLELLSATLGSCILTMMGVYANQLGADLSGAKVKIKKELTSALPKKVVRFDVVVTVPRSFDEKVTKQIEDGARHCPVHLSLHPDIEQTITFNWG